MRDFSQVKRIVVKIGTNTLTREGQLDCGYVRIITKQISNLLRQGKQVVLVSSGAIGMGAAQLQLAQSPKEMKMRQACAAIGQPLLMTQYRKAFQRHNTAVGQVLLTAEVLDHRETYLNLRNAVETLLKLGIVPVLNENDSVSTAEIGTAFGDNDRLSALVASKIDADLLIMLSDIDALYDRNPQQHENAKPIDTVYEITDEIRRTAGDKGSRFSTGGMRTKLEAATIATNAGYSIVLAHGRTKNVIERIMDGDPIGTVFVPKRRLSNRARWILNSQAGGTICIDEGAEKALRNRKSLLPSGIIRIEGSFESGAVVLINDMAKAVTSLSSVQLTALIGKHSTEIQTLYGDDQRDVVATPEDIVLIQG